MRVFRRIAALAALAISIAGVAGCAGSRDRQAILDELNPAPMSRQAWSRAIGTYTGPIRSSTQRGGFEGYSSMDVRLDLSGGVDSPEVQLKIDNGFSTAWAYYGERKGFYTDIPSKRYGAQGTVFASTHAPNQLLLQTRRYGASSGTGVWMILTFQPGGIIDVDTIGHSGWRGDGELWRAPSLLRGQ